MIGGKNRGRSVTGVLYQIELPCDDSLLYFILKTFLNIVHPRITGTCLKKLSNLKRTILFEKCFDLCHASSLWELAIVRSGISVLFKCPTLPLPYVQMPDPRDISCFQIPAPAGMKADQMPEGCPGWGCLSFDLIDLALRG